MKLVFSPSIVDTSAGVILMLDLHDSFCEMFQERFPSTGSLRCRPIPLTTRRCGRSTCCVKMNGCVLRRHRHQYASVGPMTIALVSMYEVLCPMCGIRACPLHSNMNNVCVECLDDAAMLSPRPPGRLNYRCHAVNNCTTFAGPGPLDHIHPARRCRNCLMWACREHCHEVMNEWICLTCDDPFNVIE